MDMVVWSLELGNLYGGDVFQLIYELLPAHVKAHAQMMFEVAVLAARSSVQTADACLGLRCSTSSSMSPEARCALKPVGIDCSKNPPAVQFHGVGTDVDTLESLWQYDGQVEMVGRIATRDWLDIGWRV